MEVRVGIENNFEGRSLAWALELPGCFAYGSTQETALAAMPDAVFEYASWITQRNEGECWVQVTEIELYLDECWDVYTINEQFELAEQGYEVNAWFRHDWKPLSKEEIDRGLKLLRWSRADLMGLVKSLPPEMLFAEHPGERWNIAGILKHIGAAEWWYLDRLSLAFPRERVPADPYQRLQVVRDRLEEVLPTLSGVRQVVGVDGEFWSPRKLLRRAIWHERDHTFHIQKLLP